ncbi:CCHC-type domain-containing protein [Trichonephila clavipes]|nr:CCHC-type domain-containing protein [Trichonephila clavipes]
MTTCIPGIALQQFQLRKKQDLLHMEFYHHLPSWAMNEQMYFSSFSDEWSRDLKSVQVQKQRSCRGRWEISPCVSGFWYEITHYQENLVPGISAEGASHDLFERYFGPAVKCRLVYVPIGLATGGQVNVVHQQVLCALAEVLVEDVLLPPDVLDMLGGAQSEENSLAQSSQDLRVDSGNVDETEVSSVFCQRKHRSTLRILKGILLHVGMKWEHWVLRMREVTAEMDKGSMVADSFRSEQECCAELALAWKYAKEGKGNYYEVDGYLFRRDKILGRVLGSWWGMNRCLHLATGRTRDDIKKGSGNDRGEEKRSERGEKEKRGGEETRGSKK